MTNTNVAIPVQVLDARRRALADADDLYAQADVRRERYRPDLAVLLSCGGDRRLMDARALTGELVSEGDGKPILLAPLPSMHR